MIEFISSEQIKLTILSDFKMTGNGFFYNDQIACIEKDIGKEYFKLTWRKWNEDLSSELPIIFFNTNVLELVEYLRFLNITVLDTDLNLLLSENCIPVKLEKEGDKLWIL